MKIQVGIIGYGTIGRGVELALLQNDDMELTGIFTRRDPAAITPLTPGVKVYSIAEAEQFQGAIDVMILCGGSATDLPEQGPCFAKMFNTIDSFDTHARIPEYYTAMNEAALDTEHVSIISVGWDPGLFSLTRAYAGAILPEGKVYTFWGKGVSQGHSDAIRRVPGVKNAIQYTIPVEEAMEEVRSGRQPDLSTRQKHLRECFVVAEDGADLAAIESAIISMPNYFSDYDTTVHFISEDELKANHGAMAHGGFVIRTGKTGLEQEHNHVVEFSLKLDSNPEFTANVLAAYARAAVRLADNGDFGAKSVLDIPPALLSPKSGEALRKELL